MGPPWDPPGRGCAEGDDHHTPSHVYRRPIAALRGVTSEAPMFGLGFQELLLLFILLVGFLFLNPGAFYLLSLIGLKLLKSPRLVLLAFWVLAAIYEFTRASQLSTNLLMESLFIIPLGLALQLAWLWLVGLLWQWVGPSRLGTAWRKMASLYFHSLQGPSQGVQAAP